MRPYRVHTLVKDEPHALPSLIPICARVFSPSDQPMTGLMMALLLTDFAPKPVGTAAPISWAILNDTVMGGRSESRFKVDAGVMRFEGIVRTRGGGFASFRSSQTDFDLRGWDGIRLKVRADGRRYTVRLNSVSTQSMRIDPSYRAEFDTRGGPGWQTVDIPFDRFYLQWRGRSLSDPPIDLRSITNIGVAIADKKDGPFLIEIDSLSAWRKPFEISALRNTIRPMLIFGPSADDARVQAQQAAIAQSGSAFDARDMLPILVLAKGESKAGERTLTVAEAQALRSAYRVGAGDFAVRLLGKDGGVKHAADAPVEMQAVYRLIDAMPMRAQEIKDRQ